VRVTVSDVSGTAAKDRAATPPPMVTSPLSLTHQRSTRNPSASSAFAVEVTAVYMKCPKYTNQCTGFVEMNAEFAGDEYE